MEYKMNESRWPSGRGWDQDVTDAEIRAKKDAKAARRRAALRARHEAYLSAGMVKVKSDSGKVYYE